MKTTSPTVKRIDVGTAKVFLATGLAVTLRGIKGKDDARLIAEAWAFVGAV